MGIPHHLFFFLSLGIMIAGFLVSCYQACCRAPGRDVPFRALRVGVLVLLIILALREVRQPGRLIFILSSFLSPSRQQPATFKRVGTSIEAQASKTSSPPASLSPPSPVPTPQIPLRAFTSCKLPIDGPKPLSRADALAQAAEAAAVLKASNSELEELITPLLADKLDIIPASQMHHCARERLLTLTGRFFNDTRRGLLRIIGSAGPEAAPLVPDITSVLLLGTTPRQRPSENAADPGPMRGDADSAPWNKEECTRKSYGMLVKYVGARCAMDEPGTYSSPCDGPQYAESERVAEWRKAIAQIGAQAETETVSLLSHSAPQLRVFALHFIAGADLKMEGLKDKVRALLQDPYVWIRIEALSALEHLLAESDFSALAAKLARTDEVKNCLPHKMFAYQAAKLGPSAVPLLWDIIEGKRESDSCTAAHALGKVKFIPAEMEEQFIAAIEKLSSPHAFEPCVHQGLLQALGRVRPVSARTLQVLNSALSLERQPSCKFRDIPRFAALGMIEQRPQNRLPMPWCSFLLSMMER